MKFLIYLSLILLPLSLSARDPGTGSNTTVGPAGPATPDAGSSDTSIMGGGTPGNEGMDTLNIDEPTEEELDIMYQKQEEKKDENKKDDEIKE